MKLSYIMVFGFLLLGMVLVLAVGPSAEPLGCCKIPTSFCQETSQSVCTARGGEFFSGKSCEDESIIDCIRHCCCDSWGDDHFVPDYTCTGLGGTIHSDITQEDCWGYCGEHPGGGGDGNGGETEVFDISGTVKDELGRGLVSAKVYIQDHSQYFSPTDAQGAYTIRDVPKNLNPGYDIRAHRMRVAGLPDYALSDPIRVLLDDDYTNVNFVLYPAEGSSCTLAVPALTYSEVYAEPTVHLEWTRGDNVGDCDNVQFNRYLLSRCDQRYGNCHELTLSPPNTLAHDDTGLEANTKYCYKVEAKYFQDGSFVSTFSNDAENPACPTIGDPPCLIPHPEEFCYEDKASRCGIYQEETNDIQEFADCPRDDKHCIVRDGPPARAVCISPLPCANCTGLLGMSSFLDPSFDLGAGSQVLCSLTEQTYCFKDRALIQGTAKVVSPVSVFQGCENVERCQDYSSKETCQGATGDPCDKILGECEWKYTVPSLGIGYCTLSGDQSAECALCDEIYTDDIGCNKPRCLDLNPDCYYNERNPGDYPGVEPDQSACVARENMTCAFYDYPEDCAPNTRFDLNITYENGVAVDGDHRIISRSDDTPYHFGKCYWDASSSACIKNSDEHIDPSNVLDDCGKGAQATKICLQDVNPPETEDFLVAGQEYSIQELGNANFYTVRDPENDFGEPVGNPPTRPEPNTFARFCIYRPDDVPCYPRFPPGGLEYGGSPVIEPGEYILRYYARDASMNLEQPKESLRIFLKDTGVPMLHAVYIDGVRRVSSPFEIRALKPEITLEFDRPVGILDAFPLLDTGGTRYGLKSLKNNSESTNFTFTPKVYLPTGVYSIFVEFKSLADQTVVSQDYGAQFTVTTSSMRMIPLDPAPYAGNRLISQKQNFEFVIEVSDPLVTNCFVGDAPDASEPMLIGNTSLRRKVQSGRLPPLPRDAGTGDSYLSTLKQVWVTCYALPDGRGNVDVSYQDFYLGIDDTPPSVALSAVPSSVTDFGSAYFMLGMESNDHVVCAYANPDPAFPGPVPLFSYDRTLYENYILESDPAVVGVEFIGSLPRPENIAPHDLSYTVTCTNLAGLKRTVPKNVLVNFSQVIRITPVSPDMIPDLPGADPRVWVGKNPKVNITTDIPVRSCAMKVNDGSPQNLAFWRGTAQAGYTGFAIQPTLTLEGRNNLSIVCTTEPDTPGFVTKNYTFKYDGTLPVGVGVEAKATGCTPGNLSARFVANDSLSGISNFTIALYRGTTKMREAVKSPKDHTADGKYWVDYTYQKVAGNDIPIEEGKQYTWKVFATDNAGNPSTPLATKDVTQNPRDSRCRIPLSIKTKSPRLGISAISPHFDLVLETNRTAECRWHLSGPRNYNEMTGTFNENKDGARSSLHTTRWENDFPRRIYVKCYDDQDFLHDTFIYVGYDPSAPGLQRFDVIPNPVIDPLRKIAQVFVESTGDPVFCSCDGDTLCLSSLNKSEDNYTTYLPEDLFVLNYTSYPNNYNQTILFRYQMTCSNGADPRADSIVTRNFNGTLKLVDGVIMTLVEPGRYTKATSVNLFVRTNIQSTCLYKKEADSQYTEFSGEGTEFTASLGALPEGDHGLTVECSSGTKITNQQFTFTVDRAAPSNTTVQVIDPQCGLNTLRANVSALDAGSGIENFTYILSMRSDLLEFNIANGSLRSTGVAELRYDGALQSNATYYWKVVAIDKAGNNGSIATEDVRVYGLNTPQCDFGKPKGSLRKWYYDEKTDALVGCTDKESGCADSFKYFKANLAEMCSYSVVETLGKFVPLTQKVKFCYAVYDRIGNNDTRSEIVQVYDVPEHCSNGIRDDNETSLDCGGDCIPCVLPECGDGKVNMPGEECDILDFGGIDGCNDGLFYGAFSGGTLKCTADCKLDTRQCVGQSGGACRDNVINTGESCEMSIFESVDCKDLYPAAVNGTITCKSCKVDTSGCKYPGVSCERDSDCMSRVCDEKKGICVAPACDDGVKNGDEGGVDCGGSCPGLCQVGECNDGLVNNPGEVCDGTDFGTISGCLDPIFRDAFTGGTLRCTDMCRLSTLECIGSVNGTCGDNNISVGEQCDPSSSVVASCQDLYTGASGGDVFCSSACLLDASLCEYQGVGCNGDSDCQTDWCNEGVCLVGACDDNLLNQDETDVDCGGSCSADCAEGGGCRLNTDCTSGYCDMETVPHTCVANPDADKDGIPDKCELLWGLDPYDGADGYLDPDNDGLNNKEEYGVSLRFNRTGTCKEASDINNPDTDGDGFNDGMEVERGYDPKDKNSHPPRPNEEDPINRAFEKPTPVIAIIFLIVGLVLVLGGGGYLGYSTFMVPLGRRPVERGQVQVQQVPQQGQQQGQLPQVKTPPKAAAPEQQPMSREEFLKRRKVAKERDALRKKMRESLVSTFSDDEPLKKRPEK